MCYAKEDDDDECCSLPSLHGHQMQLCSVCHQNGDDKLPESHPHQGRGYDQDGHHHVQAEGGQESRRPGEGKQGPTTNPAKTFVQFCYVLSFR